MAKEQLFTELQFSRLYLYYNLLVSMSTSRLISVLPFSVVRRIGRTRMLGRYCPHCCKRLWTLYSTQRKFNCIMDVCYRLPYRGAYSGASVRSIQTRGPQQPKQQQTQRSTPLDPYNLDTSPIQHGFPEGNLETLEQVRSHQLALYIRSYASRIRT